jgi:hypothetical protein
MEQAKIRDYDGTMMFRWYVRIRLNGGKEKWIVTWAKTSADAEMKVYERPTVSSVLEVEAAPSAVL